MMLGDIKLSFLNFASLLFSWRYIYLYEWIKNIFITLWREYHNVNLQLQISVTLNVPFIHKCSIWTWIIKQYENQATTKLLRQVIWDMTKHLEANNMLKFNLSNKCLNRSNYLQWVYKAAVALNWVLSLHNFVSCLDVGSFLRHHIRFMGLTALRSMELCQRK